MYVLYLLVIATGLAYAVVIGALGQ